MAGRLLLLGTLSAVVALKFEDIDMDVEQRHEQSQLPRVLTKSMVDSRVALVAEEAHLDGLPNAVALKHMWTSRLEEERSSVGTARFPEDVRLVLGIFTRRRTSAAVHEALQTTWMSQPGVCPLPLGLAMGCGVYVAFVMGDSWSQRASGPYTLFLNGVENMNSGKSRLFFRHVSFFYPWATHIAKMDLDTYPYLHKLTWSLHQHLSSCDAFIGVPMDYDRCSRYSHCPPEGCGLPQAGNFLNYSKEGCWSYMQGGLYIMTTSLAQAVTQDGGYWSRNSKGFEDLKAGLAISSLTEGRRNCIKTWDPEAWDHLGSPCITGREFKCQKLEHTARHRPEP